jgi:myo-inositol-1(or 4)-monophosphatase
MIDLKYICTELEKAAMKQVQFILKESEGFDINKTEKKGLNDFVSYVDKGSEKMLVEKLSLGCFLKPDLLPKKEHQKKSV